MVINQSKENLPICCVLCKYFHFDPGSSDYSELTPGESAYINCSKDHYRKYIDEITEKQYKETMLLADTCPDFEKADFVK